LWWQYDIEKIRSFLKPILIQNPGESVVLTGEFWKATLAFKAKFQVKYDTPIPKSIACHSNWRHFVEIYISMSIWR
jgi:hypothetical protein